MKIPSQSAIAHISYIVSEEVQLRFFLAKRFVHFLFEESSGEIFYPADDDSSADDSSIFH